VRLAAVWRRPKLTARGDPWHDQAVAAVMVRLLALPRRAVVLAEDETHLNLLPHVRASWTRRGARPQVRTPGTNRQVTVFGALEVTAGTWACRLGRRRAADFTEFPGQVLRAFPRAPAIVVICDNDSIHHARAVAAWLQDHPRLELLYGARYSPHDNPVERIWAGLKNYVANTAVTWPGRLRQVHAFFRARSPDQLLAAAAPWTSPWLPPATSGTFGMPLSHRFPGGASRRREIRHVSGCSRREPALSETLVSTRGLFPVSLRRDLPDRLVTAQLVTMPGTPASGDPMDPVVTNAQDLIAGWT
jgi:hypothetical protein